MRELIKIFGTRMKALEIMALLNDIKPVVRQGFYDDELVRVKKFCNDNNLFIVESEFKILLEDKDKGFSNKGIKVGKDNDKGMTFVYISKDELKAYQASYSELTQDHTNLGEVLGYPECCIKFFEKNFPERSKLDNDYEIPVLENSEDQEYPFYTNIFFRHKDYCLLSHFPCHLGCESSIKQGKEIFSLLQNEDKEMADEFRNNLEINIKSKKFY